MGAFLETGEAGYCELVKEFVMSGHGKKKPDGTVFVPPRCDFYGCNDPVCDADKEMKTGKRYCQEHSDKFTQLIKGEDIAGLVRLWAQSYGPPEIAEKEMIK